MFMKNQEKIIESYRMSNITEDYISQYLRTIIPESNDFFKKLEDYAHANHIPIVEPEVAQLLKVLTKIIKPKRILEIGTAIGYSALIMASSSENSLITTIERNENMIEVANDNINNSIYSERINIISGDAKDVLPKLDGTYDFIFLDAAKGQYLDFFNYSSKMLSKGGIIVSDNVLFRGMVASDQLVVRRKKTIVKRLRSYLEYISNLDGYTTSILALGDGLALTYKE